MSADVFSRRGMTAVGCLSLAAFAFMRCAIQSMMVEFVRPRALRLRAVASLCFALLAGLGSSHWTGSAEAATVTTLAGAGPAEDGPALQATFSAYQGDPTNGVAFNGVVVDASGNVYVADTYNCKIRKITAAGVVSTLAGSGNCADGDGAGTVAQFRFPTGIAVDAAGDLYIADSGNHKIRKVTAAGNVSTVAGLGFYQPGSVDGANTVARFNNPTGVAVDSAGNVYVGDTSNAKIRKISTAGVVTTLAGSGASGSTNGTGTAASFWLPRGVAVDGSGNVYVADSFNNKVRKISSAGVVTTLAGSGVYGSADGIGTTASFRVPNTVSLDAAGNVYVPDFGSHTIRKITAGGVVTTLAGSGLPGSVNATGPAASFYRPTAVASDAAGTLYVADSFTALIRKVTTAGVVTTFAGSGPSIGSVDGKGKTARFVNPIDVAVDAAGNVYVADTFNYKIRKITAAGVVTVLAGSGASGLIDGTGAAASFGTPWGLAIDTAGSLYVGDQNSVRKVTAAGAVTTLAGSAATGSVDALGSAASFNGVRGLCIDAAGNIYVADSANHKIRMITGAGVVTTLAGSGTAGSTDGLGSVASFNQPSGVAVDVSGNVYVTDAGNNKVRKISPAGEVTTLAGSGAFGSADGTGTAATFGTPWGVAVDPAGTLYIGDSNNNLVRKISTAGVVTTLAGTSVGGSVDGFGTAASFGSPRGLAVDSVGNVFVADTSNNKIRKITGDGPTVTVASASPNPANSGQTVTLTATVTGAAPTGLVQFFDAEVPLGAAQTLASAQAALQTASLGTGSHAITATYLGNASNQSSPSSAPVALVVNQVADNTSAGTAVTVSPADPITGKQLTTITFGTVGTAGVTTVDSGISLPTTPALRASCSPPIGVNISTTASFSGNVTVCLDTAQFGATCPSGSSLWHHNGSVWEQLPPPASSPAGQLCGVTASLSPFTILGPIQLANSSTSLAASSAGPTVAGQSVTFTATVAGSNPTGTVQFKDGAANLSSAVTLSSGAAAYTTNALTVGSHSITAAYSGDGSNTASVSLAVTQVVNQATSSTALSVNPLASTSGQTVTLTATVTGFSPAGSVQFKDGATNLGAAVALSGGTATLSINTLSAGSHSLTAVYSGDTNNAASTSPGATVTVAAGGGGSGDVPTLPEWGLILLGTTLLMQGWRRMAR